MIYYLKISKFKIINQKLENYINCSHKLSKGNKINKNKIS